MTQGSTRNHLITAALCVVLAVLAVQYFGKVYQHPNRSAFLRWSNQLQDLREGENIWHKHNYPNPPIMALLLLPLTFLPDVAGAMTWFALKAALALVSIHWVWRMLERDGRLPLSAKVLSLLLALKPIEGDLSHGNVNLFILFLVVASLFAFTHGHDWLAGLTLGLAIACKVTPALFLPYLAWKRAWKSLAGCAIGLMLFLSVVPGAVLGVEENSQYLSTWARRMVLPYLVGNEVTSEHQNQSLPGLLQRLLTESPSFSVRTETEYIPIEHHHLVELDPALVQGIVKMTFVLYLGLLAWSCRTPLDRRGDWRLVAEFGLVVLGMLLFSERTWKHHCVTLILPAAVLSRAIVGKPGAEAGAPSPRGRRLCIVCLVLAGLCMLSTSTGLFPAQGRLGDLALVYGAYVWAFILLGVPLVYLVRAQAMKPAEIEVFQARISCTTEPDTSGNGLPVRSWTSVSGSMPRR